MPDPIVTVVVPTLAVGDALEKCLNSLELQTLDLFDIVVVDNSGAGRARAFGSRTRVIVNRRNVGFAVAANQGIRNSNAVYVAILNDDTIADRRWLETLIACAEANPHAGMFACEVRLMGTLLLDSAGMLIAADGSSKQRGHEQPAADFMESGAALSRALRPHCTAEVCLIASVFLTRTFFCTARIPIWDCARAGPDGTAAMYRER